MYNTGFVTKIIIFFFFSIIRDRTQGLLLGRCSTTSALTQPIPSHPSTFLRQVYVAQDGLELLGSSDGPMLALQVARLHVYVTAHSEKILIFFFYTPMYHFHIARVCNAI
jgi:hypothetical protein